MKVLVTGGGTGGHIYPALAVIKELFSREDIAPEILYVGTSGGMEANIIPDKGLDFTTVTVRGLKRSIDFGQIYFARDFLKGLIQSRKIISKFQPDVVLGTGGYVCGPVLIAAKMSKIPTVIHEQNVIPGITNKLLARVVDYTCVSFPESKSYFQKSKKLLVTGNPRAQEISSRDYSGAKEQFSLNSNLKTLLIVSGSRGAKVINETVLEILPELIYDSNIQVIYVTGEEYYVRVKEEMNESISDSQRERVFIHPYLADLPAAIDCADLVISRAGATTLAELTAAGKPAILIPSPNVTNDHQNKNAKILGDRGAAQVITESQLQSKQFLYLLQNLLTDDNKLAEMSNQSFKLGYPEAASHISDLLISQK